MIDEHDLIYATDSDEEREKERLELRNLREKCVFFVHSGGGALINFV